MLGLCMRCASGVPVVAVAYVYSIMGPSMRLGKPSHLATAMSCIMLEGVALHGCTASAYQALQRWQQRLQVAPTTTVTTVEARPTTTSAATATTAATVATTSRALPRFECVLLHRIARHVLALAARSRFWTVCRRF